MDILEQVISIHIFDREEKNSKLADFIIKPDLERFRAVNFNENKLKSINNRGDKVTYGLNAECDFPADIHHDNNGSILLTIDAQEIKTKSKNLSFVKNIIAVSAVSVTLEIEWKLFQERIFTFKTPRGRFKL